MPSKTAFRPKMVSAGIRSRVVGMRFWLWSFWRRARGLPLGPRPSLGNMCDIRRGEGGFGKERSQFGLPTTMKGN